MEDVLILRQIFPSLFEQDKALKNSTPGKVAYIWRIERFQIDAIKFERTQIHFFSDVFTRRCLRSLMHCIRFWNLFKIWRVLEATYLKLHGKEKSRNKNLRSHQRIELGHFRIRHLHISHNTPCLHAAPKFCITFVFHFSWVLQLSQKKLMTMFMHNYGGQTR